MVCLRIVDERPVESVQGVQICLEKHSAESTQKVAAAGLVFWTILQSVYCDKVSAGNAEAFAAVLYQMFPNTDLLWLLISSILPVKSKYIYFYNFID